MIVTVGNKTAKRNLIKVSFHLNIPIGFNFFKERNSINTL